MLLSMTGFGEARGQIEGLSVAIEVRAVNNRYLKVTVRGSEPYPMFEAELEKVIRRHVRRGTLLVHVRVDRPSQAKDLKLNTTALKTYLQQIRGICNELGQADYAAPLLAGVLDLPGVAPEPVHFGAPPEDEWPIVERTLEDSLRRLDAMRKDEGQAMAKDLLHNHRHIKDQLELIRRHMPTVMGNYRQRLTERVKQALGDANVAVAPEHLIREVALYADRSDVDEEVTRLSAHLESFENIVRLEEDGPGRKLEFVVQEMGRETNTLGSKAGDVTISRYVVEIKATLEKIRELVQNVE